MARDEREILAVILAAKERKDHMEDRRKQILIVRLLNTPLAEILFAISAPFRG